MRLPVPDVIQVLRLLVMSPSTPPVISPKIHIVKKPERTFSELWLHYYAWLHFREEENKMTCTIYKIHGKKHTCLDGTGSVRSRSLQRQAGPGDEKAPVVSEGMRNYVAKAMQRVITDKGNATIVALRPVLTVGIRIFNGQM